MEVVEEPIQLAEAADQQVLVAVFCNCNVGLQRRRAVRAG